MEITHPHPICYLDPAVEEALYTPGETSPPSPMKTDHSIADDLAEEWDEGEFRPAWLNNL